LDRNPYTKPRRDQPLQRDAECAAPLMPGRFACVAWIRNEDIEAIRLVLLREGGRSDEEGDDDEKFSHDQNLPLFLMRCDVRPIRLVTAVPRSSPPLRLRRCRWPPCRAAACDRQERARASPGSARRWRR